MIAIGLSYAGQTVKPSEAQNYNLVCFSGSFFLTQLLSILIIVLQNTFTTGKESVTALRCTLADPGAVRRVEKYGGESFQERSSEPLGCHS